MVYDETGQLLTGTFLDYALALATDVPAFETIIVEVPSADGPYGARGIGEGPVCGAAAAVANAIAAATGVRFRTPADDGAPRLARHPDRRRWLSRTARSASSTPTTTSGSSVASDTPGSRSRGSTRKTAYLGDYRSLREDWGPARLAAAFEGSNVVKAVHVEADCTGPDPVEETAWLAAVATEWGMPNAIVAFADLERDGVEASLDRHLAASELVRGVRIREHPADPTARAFRRGLRALAIRGLSYDVNAGPDRLASTRAAALAEPDLQLILCHTGDPPRRDADMFSVWRREMHALAEAPNVACKISGLGMGDHAWTVASIRPWVLEAIDAFGIERSMFATNWPVDSLYGTYRGLVDAYRTIVAEAGFSNDDQRALLAGNAERILPDLVDSTGHPGPRGTSTTRRFGSSPIDWVATFGLSRSERWIQRRSSADIGSSWSILPVSTTRAAARSASSRSWRSRRPR